MRTTVRELFVVKSKNSSRQPSLVLGVRYQIPDWTGMKFRPDTSGNISSSAPPLIRIRRNGVGAMLGEFETYRNRPSGDSSTVDAKLSVTWIGSPPDGEILKIRPREK
jgi:hypothetical protein